MKMYVCSPLEQLEVHEDTLEDTLEEPIRTRQRTTRCVPVDISTTLVRRVLVDRMLRMLRGFVTRHASTLWMVARICRKAEVTEAHGSVATGSEQSSDSGAV
jgi:hypothetical protein